MRRLPREAYTIGWVCALPIEQTAAMYMLDERHESVRIPKTDQNAYTLGKVGRHYVVIVGLPMGRIGNNPAATVATQMASTFPNIRVGLMVGVGGGTPKKTHLGDVVISCPGDHETGVIQWDMGKAEFGGQFKRTQRLAPPPSLLLSSVAKFEADRMITYSNMRNYLDRLRNMPDVDESFLKSDSLEDILYEPGYCHVDGNEDCSSCDKTKIINGRSKRNDMKIHYGLIASGNKVIKDASLRDDLYQKYKVLCIEMEAAGLMNDFPCVVIRGICDYADSHANKKWQKHAAAAAAACAKAFLDVVPEQEIYELQSVQASITPGIVQDTREIRLRDYAANSPPLSPSENLDAGKNAAVLSSASASEMVKSKDTRRDTKPPGKIYATPGETFLDSNPSAQLFMEALLREGGSSPINKVQLEAAWRKFINDKNRIQVPQEGANDPNLNNNPQTPPLSPECDKYEDNGYVDDGPSLRFTRTAKLAPKQMLSNDEGPGPMPATRRSQTFPSDQHSGTGRAALFAAVEGGHIATIKRLVEEGTDLGMTDEFGLTPLWRAVLHGKHNVIRALIEFGASTEARNADGEDVLGWAVAKSRHDIIETLGYN